MFNLGDVLLRLVLGDTSQFRSQVQREAEAAGGKAGQTMGQKIASNLKTGFGALAGGLLVGATEQASKFEDQLRTINTVAKLSDSDLAAVGEGIKRVSSETGKDLTDLTGGFYDLVSAGVPASDALDVLRNSAILATGALGTTGETVDLVTSVLGAYGLEASKSGRITDIFAQAVADGKTTVADLSQSIGSLAPIAASAGVSMEEVAAGTALVTLSGSSASEAMTQMRNTIQALMTPNEALNEIQRRTKLNFADIAREKGLGVALEELRKATKGNNDEFGRALGSSQALNYAFQVTGGNAAKMAKELGNVQEGADTGGVALGQYTEKSKSAVEQGKRLIANIQNFLVTVGGPLVSTLGPAIFAFNQLGAAFGLQGIAAKALGAVFGGLAVSLTGRLKGLKLGARFRSVVSKGMEKIGDPIADGLASGWKRASSSGPVSGAIDGASKLMGSKLGKGLSIAFAAVAVFEVIDTYNRIKAETAAQGEAIGSSIGEQIGSGTVDSLEQSRAAVIQGINDLMAIPDFGIITGDSKARLFAELDRLNAEIAERERKAAAPTGIVGAAGADLGDKYGAGVSAGIRNANIADVVSKVVSSSIGNVRIDTLRVARAAGLRGAQALAQGFQDGRDAVKTAWNGFLDILENAEAPAKERARLLGELTSKELQKGLHSQDPYVRATAQTTKQIIIDRLNELKTSSKNIGKKGMAELALAMKSKDPDIRAAAAAIYRAATAKPSTIPAAMTIYGRKAGAAYAAGLRSTYGLVNDAANYVARGAVGPFRASSPPGPESPLHLIDKWGERTGEAWIGPFAAAIANGRAALVRAVAGVGTALTVPHAQPDFSPFATPAMTFARAAPGAGVASPVGRNYGKSGAGTIINHYHLTAKVEAPRKARDPLAIAKQMGRAARSGEFARIKGPVDDE